MKKQKKQLLLLLILACVCVVAALLLRMQKKGETLRPDEKKLFDESFVIQSAAVFDGAVLEGGKQARYTLQGSGDAFMVIGQAGEEQAADGEKGKEMLSLLQELTGSHFMTAPADVSIYGLQPPSMSILLRDSSGKEQILEIGDLSTGAGMYYARIKGEEAVCLITTLVKSLFDVAPETLYAS